MDIGIKEVVFLVVIALTVVPGFLVALSRNILYSAFALFFTFLGTAGLYLFLDADFLAVVQLLIYIGGVLVLLLFAILLTRNIDNMKRTNALSIRRAALAGIGAIVLFGVLLVAFFSYEWVRPGAEHASSPAVTVHELGSLLLSTYLLPFEVASILLLAVLIGSLVIAGRSVR